MLDLCSISLKPNTYGGEAEDDCGYAVSLIGLIGRDDRLFDIACELEADELEDCPITAPQT